jgi:hypothetical protein
MDDSRAATEPPGGSSAPWTRDESIALGTILGNQNICIKAFFESIWQAQCGVFTAASAAAPPPTPSTRTFSGAAASTSSTASGPDDEEDGDNPYTALVRNGWNVLVKLLEASTGNLDDDGDGDGANVDERQDVADAFRPLLFQNQVQVPPDVADAKYGGNLFSAYLDGCSVVVNHSDSRVAEIASLCVDLQRSFPHTYANAYLTPPGLQAVPAHADDRDVLVVQVVGEKTWRVYQAIPVPYPYQNEQVGKAGLPVPPPVFEKVLVERTLRPGDALYMPRGYVHEARAREDALSFHITVALATHDWSLAGVLSHIASKVWTNELEFRPAMHRDIGTVPFDCVDKATKQQLQQDLDRAMNILRKHLTVEGLHQRMKCKYDHHNTLTAGARRAIIDCRRQKHVASHVTLDTPLRCSTPEERSHVIGRQRSDRSPRGLHVRNEIFDPIMQILQAFRDNSDRSFTMRYFIHDAEGRGVCDLALLSFARICVEQGALTVV